MNQGVKYFQSLHQIANQANTLLTVKQIEQIDSILEKCIIVLTQSDKASFVKLLISFFKLFLHCPFASTEIFYKKYYAIMKEGFQFKTKNPAQQKYECLILTLFDTADKYYSSIFTETIKNSKDVSYNELLQNILTINIKGGLNFKGFLALLRKFIERDKENSKISQIGFILKDVFSKFLFEMNEDIRKNGKNCQNHAFKFFFINSLVEQISRFDPNWNAFLKQLAKEYLSRLNEPSSSKIFTYFQFLALNQHKILFQQIFLEKKPDPIKGNLEVKIRNNYQVDILSSLLVIRGIQMNFDQSNTKFLTGVLYLLKHNYRSIEYVCPPEKDDYSRLETMVSLKQTQILEEITLQLLLNIKIHGSSLENSKIQPLSLVKTFVTVTSSSFQKFGLHSDHHLQTAQSQFFELLLKTDWLTVKGKVYVALLYFTIFSSSADYERIIYSQHCLFLYLKKIADRSNKNFNITKDFLQQIYLFINFKSSKNQYMNTIFRSKRSTSNILSQVLQHYQRINYQDMVDQTEINEFLQNNINKFSQPNYTFQNLIDLIANIFQQNNDPTFQNELTNDVQFNQLSLTLFDKINIKPKSINRISEQISFIKEKSKRKTMFCLRLLRKLYQLDTCIKSNSSFLETVPENENNGQKIIVLAIKKYFGIYYNRINDLVIRKWVINRNYLIIWSLLLCNYKVKTIAEQLLKCGIAISQLKSLFNLQEIIVKQFIQYLISKDKLKFKLALFNCGLTHRIGLIDYSLPEIVL